MLASAGAHQGLSTLSNKGEPPPLSLDLPQNISQLLSLPQQASAPMPHSYELGGMIGEGGQPVRPPAMLSSAGHVNNPAYVPEVTIPRHSYEMGGQIGAGGAPMRPPGTMTSGAALLSNSGQPAGNNLNSVQDSIAQNPAAAQRLRQEIQSSIQAGDITQQDLNMLVSMAQMSMQNPGMYPQLRQNLVSQGFPEDILAPQFEQAEGALAVIVSMGEALTTAPQGGGAPSAAMQPSQGSYEQGGALPTESKNEDGSIPITAHEGEYVATKDAVAYHGRKTYDKLEEQAKNPQGKGASNGT